MVSWPDQCSLGLSVILASTLTSATPTHTFMHMCPATVRSWRVVSAAIESPGQQVDKGDTAGGMPGEGRRVSGWRWGEGWLLENVDRRWEGAGGCRGWGVGQADLGLCTVVRWGAKATGREGGVWSGKDKGCDAVINDKAHRHTRHASWPLRALCRNSRTGVFGVVTFPTLLIDERFLSHHKLW